MRIFLLLAIAVCIVYILDRQTRRWLQGVGRAVAAGDPEGPATAPANRGPAPRQGRLVVCAGCGVRVAESLAERSDSGSFYCSATCWPTADGR